MRLARAHGIKVIGFCGILVKALQRGNLSLEQVRDCIDIAIREHGLRILLVLYQRIAKHLGQRATASEQSLDAGEGQGQPANMTVPTELLVKPPDFLEIGLPVDADKEKWEA